MKMVEGRNCLQVNYSSYHSCYESCLLVLLQDLKEVIFELLSDSYHHLV